MDILGFLNVNVVSVMPFGCSFSLTYVDQMKIMTILPFIFTIFIYLLYAIHVKYIKRSNQRQMEGANNKDVQTMSNMKMDIQHTKDRYFVAFLVMTYLVLPTVCTIIFKTFLCENIDPNNLDDLDDWFLIADYR
jgi:predicted histidine transporter YuiF (NhaC family)